MFVERLWFTETKSARERETALCGQGDTENEINCSGSTKIEKVNVDPLIGF
jgi:hypothetical protein